MSALLGMVGIGYALWFAFSHEGGSFTGYFSLPGLVLLLIAPPSIMLLSHSLSDFLMGIKLVVSSALSRQRKHHDEVITLLTQVAKAMRTGGIAAVQPFRSKARYDLLRDGLSLLINDFKVDEIRSNLTARINLKQSRQQLAANLFENMSRVSPGVGMIGTLMGLIGMLSHMADPAKIGSNMALAMITTLYGLALGTIVYAPCAEKIALEAEKSLEVDLLIVEGILNIKGKKSSVHLRDLMNAYQAGNKDKEAPAAKRGA